MKSLKKKDSCSSCPVMYAIITKWTHKAILWQNWDTAWIVWTCGSFIVYFCRCGHWIVVQHEQKQEALSVILINVYVIKQWWERSRHTIIQIISSCKTMSLRNSWQKWLRKTAKWNMSDRLSVCAHCACCVYAYVYKCK